MSVCHAAEELGYYLGLSRKAKRVGAGYVMDGVVVLTLKRLGDYVGAT